MCWLVVVVVVDVVVVADKGEQGSTIGTTILSLSALDTHTRENRVNGVICLPTTPVLPNYESSCVGYALQPQRR